MSNTSAARMIVGGVFTPTMAKDFDELMEKYRIEEQPASVQDCVGKHIELFDPLASWGQFPEHEKFCKKHNLPFNIEVDQDWQGPEYWMVYRPEWQSPEQFDPYPSIGLSDIEECVDSPNALRQLVREYRKRNPKVPELPVVELDESNTMLVQLEFDATWFQKDIHTCPFCQEHHEVALPRAIWRLSNRPPHATADLKCKQCGSEWSTMFKPYNVQPIRGAKVVKEVRSKKKVRTHGNKTDDSGA